MRRGDVLLSLLVVLILVGGIIVAYPYLTASNPNPLSNNRFLSRGSVTYFAFGSSASVPVNLSGTYRLTGGFGTNSSAIFYVMTTQQFGSQSPGFKSPVSCEYSTGNVKSAVINATLYAGDYDLVFRFVNDTGRIVTTINGTGLASMTALTMTQTFEFALDS